MILISNRRSWDISVFIAMAHGLEGPDSIPSMADFSLLHSV
jgi:hypothetical protein